MVKAGMQKYAAHHGIMLVFPDTSPRGSDIPDDESYDLGQGAGFYVDSVEAPWSKHFQMYSYLTKELPQLIAQEFPVDLSRQGITGHSMGGHGALMIALKSSVGTFRSVSAFSPICNPINSPWGQKQFSAYLGNDKELWKEYDASFLIKSKGSYFDSIKIDVGSNDPFLGNLMVNELEKNASGNVQVSVRNGYDHSYFFIASFAEDHIDWHAQRLACKAA
jgi:S-formylglutathione hydrolase